MTPPTSSAFNFLRHRLYGTTRDRIKCSRRRSPTLYSAPRNVIRIKSIYTCPWFTRQFTIVNFNLAISALNFNRFTFPRWRSSDDYRFTRFESVISAAVKRKTGIIFVFTRFIRARRVPRRRTRRRFADGASITKCAPLWFALTNALIERLTRVVRADRPIAAIENPRDKG